MKYIIAIIFTTLLLLLLFQRTQTKRVPLISGEKILAFGDSLTFGYGADLSQSYPAVLSKLSGYEVINQGICGELSGNGKSRLPSLLKEGDIKLMILCHGGNDILQRQSLAELKVNLEAMVKMAKSRDIEVLLIGVPNLSLIGLSSPPLYKEVADEYNIPYLENTLENILADSSLKEDQIHPNALGYRKMAEDIYQKLRDEKIIP